MKRSHFSHLPADVAFSPGLRCLAWLNIAVQATLPLTAAFTPVMATAGEQHFLQQTAPLSAPRMQVYTLGAGETAASVAKKFHLTPEQLREMNAFRTFARGLNGLRPVFFITASVLFVCFLLTAFCIRENFTPVPKKEMLHARDVIGSLKNPKLVLSLFVTTMIIQVATGSIAPILTLYVRELAGNVSNIAFISGMIASVPGVAALLSAPRLGKLGDRIGPEKILIAALVISVLLLIPMSFVQAPWQLGVLRFLLGAADGALLPAVQTLLVYNSTNQIAGRIFSYNQIGRASCRERV